MKRIVIILGSILIALVLATGVRIAYVMLDQKPLGIADRTGNINVMLTRPDNWQKIADAPVIDIADMAVLDGSTATIPITAEMFRQFYGFTDSQIESDPVVFHSTTHSAYINLIDSQNRLDRSHPTSLILVTPPSEEELQYAEDNQVELEMTPIAKDGFVFITHTNNPVDTLTVAQIQDIYTGKITNWNQVGGDDLEIKAYQREQNSGSQTVMEQMVMQGRQMLSPIGAKICIGMGMLVDAVAEFENGPASIAYTYYYYINNLYKNDNIKVINIDGIAPDNSNLISGAYPFSASYYAVMRKDEPQDSPARILRDYLVTPQGQELIAMAGYCKAVN